MTEISYVLEQVYTFLYGKEGNIRKKYTEKLDFSNNYETIIFILEVIGMKIS